MKRVTLGIAAAGMAFTGAVIAHPTEVPYDTRGECESAYAAASKMDRERLVELGFFESKGAAQRTFNERFACEYDELEDAWYISDSNI